MDGTPETPDLRTRARELALMLLYAADVSGPRHAEQQLSEVPEQEDAPAAVRDLAHEIVNGVRESAPEIDGVIQEAAVNWQVSRMPVIDRAVLRMGCYELLYMHSVPPRVTINEAVQLAKKYSTEKSGAFVNGVLDKIFQTHCPEKV